MRIPKRIAQTLINSLKGGVVPRTGLPYITVGRREEIDALLSDVEIISEGGASFRFIVGPYGSGKSFLLQTIRNYVMQKNFVVLDADLSPERRFLGRGGQGLATYRELIKNMATKTRPEGGALSLILDRWISSLRQEVLAEHPADADSPAFDAAVEKEIASRIASLQEMVHGFEFTRLLTLYYRAFTSGNDALRGQVIKWFRGEYTTKTEARHDLGIQVIITDSDWYDYLKLFAGFLKGAGYAGMLVLIDELVNIYKIPNAINRQYNYEKLLTMYNDAMQGRAGYMGMIIGGTPQCIEDPRRGVFSYEALRSRLAQGRYAAQSGKKDLLSPMIRLSPLTYEEMLVLIERLTEVHAVLYDYEPSLGDSELIAFLQAEYARVGTNSHITPREIIRDFIEVLDILMLSPEMSVASLLGSESFVYAKNPVEEEPVSDSFAEFEL